MLVGCVPQIIRKYYFVETTEKKYISTLYRGLYGCARVKKTKQRRRRAGGAY